MTDKYSESMDDKIPCLVLFSRMILLQIEGAHCNARSALTRVRHKALTIVANVSALGLFCPHPGP